MPNHHETGTTSAEPANLLHCRMSMLGLDRFLMACAADESFNEIRRRCASCLYRDACAADLKRDPNDPVWETYCPNSGAFLALTADWWLPH